MKKSKAGYYIWVSHKCTEEVINPETGKLVSNCQIILHINKRMPGKAYPNSKKLQGGGPFNKYGEAKEFYLEGNLPYPWNHYGKQGTKEETWLPSICANCPGVSTNYTRS
tara:strand:+ start:187 stop:516 length:330 start_codon:yes stop_codon:yes gene_type:complete